MNDMRSRALPWAALVFFVASSAFAGARFPFRFSCLKLKKGSRIVRLTDPFDEAVCEWRNDPNEDCIYVLKVKLSLESEEGKPRRSGRVEVGLGVTGGSVEWRKVRFYSDRLKVIGVHPGNLSSEGTLQVTLRPLAGNPVVVLNRLNVLLEKWSRPKTLFAQRRALEGGKEEGGLYVLSKRKDRIYYRFEKLERRRIARLEGRLKLPLPPGDEKVLRRHVSVGVSNEFGGMRFERAQYLPGAEEALPLQAKDVNPFNAIDVMVGYDEGKPLRVGPRDVFLKVYYHME